MRADGTYRRVATGRLPVCAQKVFMEDALASAPQSAAETGKISEFWKRLFRR